MALAFAVPGHVQAPLAPPAPHAPPRRPRLGASRAAAAAAAAVAAVARLAVRRQAVPNSPLEAKQMSQPDRRGALAERRRKILGADKTVEDVAPQELLEGDLGAELKVAMESMVEVMHALSLGIMILEDAKDRSTVGLHGFALEDKFVRKTGDGDDGDESLMPAQAALSYIMRQLAEHFPEDPVFSDEDGGLLSRDPEFADGVAQFLAGFEIMPDATAEAVAELNKLCAPFPEELPKRYWIVTPIDSVTEFRSAKQFCSTLCLMQDNEPVFSIMGCPVLSYDHPSRSTSHPSGSAIFYAVKGQGAWTQCLIMERTVGVYSGRYGLKGRSLPLKVSEKIRRGNDGLYDMLGTEQLRISQHARMRQDIFLDSERIAKLLGSDFAKFHFINSSIKFGWLARGDEDISWSITQGLYDTSGTLRIGEHAAGALIAQESGAEVVDLDGKAIDWSTGQILRQNRGLVATDPKKVPAKAILRAVKEATEKSQVLYEERCEKRREKQAMLRRIFTEMGKFAETEEEKKGAAIVKKRGLEMLDDEEEMMKITQESMNRDVPMLGQPRRAEEGSLEGPIPFSPIK